MLESEQIPLEERFSLAKKIIKSLNIGDVFRTQSKISDEILSRK